MQPEISKNKKVKTTNNKKTKEKALVKGKIQENQRKIFKIKLKKKKWKSKKKHGWDGRAKRKFKKCKINENQRKSISKEDVE